MKVLCVWKPDWAALETKPPTQSDFEAMGKLVGEMQQAGVLLDTGGTGLDGMRMRITRKDSHVSVTDGPFTETKELVGGFALMKVDSKEELISWLKRFVEVAGDGTSEICQLDEF